MNRTIIFIRHGSTDLNSDDNSVDRLRGWKDVPLNPDGKKHAEYTAKLLQDNPPGKIVTSDLKRAVETAEIISKITGAPVVWETEKFRPWNVGKYTGQLSSKAVPIIGEYAKSKPFYQIPDGESFDTFRRRFFSGLDEALDKYPGLLAVVSHHRNERLLKAWIAADYPTNNAIDIKVFNQKGEKPGTAERITFDEEKVDAVTGIHAPDKNPT